MDLYRDLLHHPPIPPEQRALTRSSIQSDAIPETDCKKTRSKSDDEPKAMYPITSAGVAESKREIFSDIRVD